MIALLAAAALQLASPDPCYEIGRDAARLPGCPAWRFVVQTEVGAASVDPASVQRRGDQMEIRTRFVLTGSETEEPITVIYWKRIDCRRRTGVELSSAVYDERGVLLHDTPTTGEDAAPFPVNPRAPQGAVLLAFCRSSAPRG